MATIPNLPGLATNNGVRTQHADYIKYSDKWLRCRDAIAGQDAVRDAGVKYLPKLREQNQTDYLGYVNRAPFYNASGRTVSGLVGMLFRKPPSNDAPENIVSLLADCDYAGTPFDVFAQEVAQECLAVGRVGVMVDHVPVPTTSAPLTIAVAQQLGLRPTVKIYKTENIINWRFKQIGNVWTLCQVVLKECYSEPAIDNTGAPSEFANVSEDRYRVLDLFNDNIYRVRVFRVDNNNKDVLVGDPVFPVLNGKPLNYIPFFVMTDEGVKFEVGEPPLIDLVNVNLSHFQSAADYEHGCHFTALPTLFISGYKAPLLESGEAPEKIYLGSQAAIVMPNADANARFVEFTGNGLKTIENNLDRKEQQMAILGARMIAAEGKQALTATTTAIHRTGENSVLAAISIAVSLGLSKALNTFAAWAGAAGSNLTYKVNRDFLPVTMDGPSLMAYIQAWQAGMLNDEEAFDLIQRADVIEGDVTFAQHKLGKFTIVAKPVPGGPAQPPKSPIEKSPNEA